MLYLVCLSTKRGLFNDLTISSQDSGLKSLRWLPGNLTIKTRLLLVIAHGHKTVQAHNAAISQGIH